MIKRSRFLVSLGLVLVLILSSTFGAFAQSSGESNVVHSKIIPVVLDYDQATNSISLNYDDILDYKPIMSIEDPDCIIEAMNLADILDDAVEVKNNNAFFDFQKAIDIVKANKGISVVGILNSNITKNNANYVEMSEAVTQTILSVLKAKIDDGTKNVFQNLIQSCYTDTEKDEQKHWVLWSKNTEHQSQYVYQLLFAIQNKNTGAFIYALPLALTVTVDKSKSKFLGMTVKDKSNYSCNIQGLQIVKLMDKYVNGGR
ncbi:toxin [Anaerobacterium chartisolvens]|uniref:Toxin n=1 Tax=Anaerobacterium chartisolvens TaxID=1297424 RepID=A0A369AFI0_9FIRM|nr:hypothetical protein [Anaerobacterium chartisolvens]RCX08079.1 toxin [Anaerobacterium chartisolvens]